MAVRLFLSFRSAAMGRICSVPAELPVEESLAADPQIGKMGGIAHVFRRTAVLLKRFLWSLRYGMIMSLSASPA